MTKQIKKLYAEYKQALKAENIAFESEDEQTVDAAIERTLEAEKAFREALVSFSGNRITERDVMRMMAFKADELENLINRMAA